MACTIDLRRLDEGFGGKTYKRKRSIESNQINNTSALTDPSMDIDSNPPKRVAVSSSLDPNKPAYGRPTYDGVIAGKVSGRNWKEPRTRASARAKSLNRKKDSYEERKKEREVKRAFKEKKEELKEEIRRNKVEKRRKREEREKRKEENVLRSGTKLQVVTNPKTLQRIKKSKHGKTMLKFVPDNLINKKKSS
ncbi:hypothetical protein Droror1_Dr00000843 [Drosera rotundifolia]